MKIRKMYLIIASILTILSIIAFSVLFFHGGYDDKVLSKLGIKAQEPKADWAVVAWKSSLKQLHYDSDIAFIGDSITQGGDFQTYFPNKKVINLGYGGDTIVGMTQRVSMLKNTSPEKVFIMGGINSLTNMNSAICMETYSTLLTSVKEAVPEAEIYVQSVLPISEKKEKELFCSNDTIKKFNKEIKKLSEQEEITYIDLYSVFAENNQMNANLSVDGLHLNSEGYKVWIDNIKDYIN